MLVKDSKMKKNKMESFDKKDKKCPLCMELLEADDYGFFPCTCMYQVCRFCWHRIRTNENGLCPNCRRVYPEDPVGFKPLSIEEVQKIKSNKKIKDLQKRQKLSENRKLLADLRIIQKNLVFILGLPPGMKLDFPKQEKFIEPYKSFGKIIKTIFNERPNNTNTVILSCAYITYEKSEAALKVLKSDLATSKFEGRELKSSLGTTKYCSNFLKNVHCHKTECMYLHDLAEDEASFTKEEIKAGNHVEYGEELYRRMMAAKQRQAAANNHKAEVSIPDEHEISPNSDQGKPENRFYYQEVTGTSPQRSTHNQPLYNRHSSLTDSREVFVSSPTSSDNSSNSQTSVSPKTPHLGWPSQQPSPGCMNGELRDLKPDEWFDNIAKAIGPSCSLYSNNDQHSHSNRPGGVANGSLLSPLMRAPFTFPSDHHIGQRTPLLAPCNLKLFQEQDDDLGFDPLQFSLDSLEVLLKTETPSHQRLRANGPNPFSPFNVNPPPGMPPRGMFQGPSTPCRPPPPSHPPPGFSRPQSYGSASSISSLSSPASNSERNSFNSPLPDFREMLLNAGGSSRQNLQMSQRHEPSNSISSSLSSLTNGFNSSPVKNNALRQLVEQQFSTNNVSRVQKGGTPHDSLLQSNSHFDQNTYGSTSPINHRLQKPNDITRQTHPSSLFNGFSNYSSNTSSLFPNLLNQESSGIHNFH